MGSMVPAVRPQPEQLSLAFRLYVTLLGLGALTFVPAGLRLAFENPGVTLLWIGLIAATNYRAIPMLPRANLDMTAGTPLGVAVAVLLPLPLAALVKLVGQTN